VFCKNDGSALDPDGLRKDALYPILDKLGIPRKKGASGFHTFRHSAASIVNEQTGNLKLAQKFLGHSTIKMTADIYTHTSAEAERGAAIALVIMAERVRTRSVHVRFKVKRPTPSFAYSWVTLR
jgi:hypothetical protein